MTLPPALELDPRDAEALRLALVARRAGYVPEWLPSARGTDAAIEPLVARYVYTILQRLNQVPSKHLLAYLDMLGIGLVPAQAARAPIVLQLPANAPTSRLLAGTQVAAPPPPEESKQVVFETERSVGLSPTRLVEVRSLYPGRDKFIDHSAALQAGAPFHAFERRRLEDTEHIVYLAHDTLLNLSGKATLDVSMDLSTVGDEQLRVAWEYWDGEVWREFKGMTKACDEEEAARLDGTNGLTQSGSYRLETDCAVTAKTEVHGLEAFWIRGRLDETLPPDPGQALPGVDGVTITTETSGEKLPLDKAFADVLPIDVSKPFQSFGVQPSVGSAFYFANDEVFSKPGASCSVEIQLAGKLTVTLIGSDPPIVAWEYWNGEGWREITRQQFPTDPDSTSASEIALRTIDLSPIPSDMTPVGVNGQEALWMRAVMVGGSFDRFVNLSTNQKAREYQSPSLLGFDLTYTWLHGPYHPTRVLALNDFHYEDHTEDAIWPGRTFKPFMAVGDDSPALYLGFDKPLPVDRIGVYFDIVERRGETEGPTLVWEYWNGFSWEDLSVEDETRHLRVPGIVSFIGPRDSRELARFETTRHWVRARLKADGLPGEPEIAGIYPNAVWAVQYSTVADEILGTSTGRADQVFRFRQAPVLPDPHIEVRESGGLRANVEWRIIAQDVYGGDESRIRDLEALLSAEGPDRDFELDGLRLRRDRQKRVTEVWVRWQERRHLRFSGARNRHFLTEAPRGRLIFGNGETGRIPPPGAAILARRYRTGGGRAGNVAARTITQTLGAIGSVEAVFNPRSAEGGADGETLEAFVRRGSRSLRHRGRALLPSDFEAMAREASASVAFARAVPGMDPAGDPVPGWLTILIIPYSMERRPWPSFGLREHVRKYVSRHASAGTVEARRIHVTGPDYFVVDVEATVAPVDPAVAGAVESGVRTAIESFFHPVTGGPSGVGWALGRGVFLSDLAPAIERVGGVDYVTDVTLRRNGVPQGTSMAVAGDRMAVVGQIRLELIGGEV